MNNEPNIQFHMQAWSDTGSIILDLPLSEGATSVSGIENEADHTVSFLGKNSVLVLKDEKRISLLCENTDTGERSEHFLSPGNPIRCAGASWMIFTGNHFDHEEDSQASSSSTLSEPNSDGIWQSVFDWVAQPMNSPEELRSALSSFLSLVIDHSNAGNGMLIGRESTSQSLIANLGMTKEEAVRMWEKMPDGLFESIIESQAHCIMPEGLGSDATSKSTIFVRHARSLAGFPIISEGRVIAILFLGFSNLMNDLSPGLQNILERTCQFAGLVLHRAMLRSELTQFKMMGQSDAAELPQGRLIIGSSEEIKSVYNIISRLAAVNVPTLILGETGTGKELAAREVHRMSDRQLKAFVAVNAAAVPENLFESQLFGHKKGSFTGALSDHKGLIEQADNGSLFIDEIGELPLNLQSKLLRVLQERAVLRIGESEPRPVDFRLICATHQNLNKLVEEGLFREDLYYRIAGAVIQMPRLKDRPNDIIELANYFKNRFAKQHDLPLKEWSANALQSLISEDWKGNVRELEHTVNRALIMSDGLTIEANDLEIGYDISSPNKKVEGAQGKALLDLTSARNRWLKSYIKEALAQNLNNRAKTAKVLGIGQRTLFRYIDQLGI